MSAVNFFWDGDNLLQEYDDAGNTVAHYVTEPDQYGNITSQHQAGQARCFHFDGLGSTVEVTSEAADVIRSERHAAFGKVVEDVGSTSLPFTYGGRVQYYYDSESATHYVRRRMYCPSTARWLSADPFGVRINDLNLYAYVRNRSTHDLDPDGLGCKVWYDCILQKEGKGPLGCTCEYVCIESTTRPRQPVAGGGFSDCEDPKIPKAITQSKSHWIKCAPYFEQFKITGAFAGNPRDCSRQACRDAADKVFGELKKACDAAGQFEEVCKAAAALWHLNAFEICEACERP